MNLEKRLPTVSEYSALRISGGWPVFTDELTSKGLANSLFGVCISQNDGLMGMGRVVGDGAIYFHIQDVIVHPNHQGKGIGKIIVIELLAYIKTPAGQNSNIGLMCSKGRERFYRSFGFIERPDDKYGAGMIKVVDE